MPMTLYGWLAITRGLSIAPASAPKCRDQKPCESTIVRSLPGPSSPGPKVRPINDDVPSSGKKVGVTHCVRSGRAVAPAPRLSVCGIV
jgi:hypothetical protein